MQLESVRTFLLWCTIINYAILILWFVIFVFAHDFFYRMHTKWFALSRETFDAINYGGISVYKIGIMLFNLVPLIVICCILS